MKITVMTLWDEDRADHFVGAILGSVSDEDRRGIAESFEADAEDDGESLRVIYFAEIEAYNNVPQALSMGVSLVNIDGDETEGAVFGEADD